MPDEDSNKTICLSTLESPFGCSNSLHTEQPTGRPTCNFGIKVYIHVMAIEKQIQRLSEQAASECLGFSVRRAARAIARHYDEALAALDIKGTQFSLMNAVQLMDGAPISALAHALVMDRTTLTRNLRPLQQKGLLEIRPGEDRRNRFVTLTPQGVGLLGKALPLWAATHGRLVAQMGAPLAKRLAHDLEELTARTRGD